MKVKDGKCEGCGKNDKADRHKCPFKVEINEDHTECVCCEDCEHECAMEI